MDNNNRMSPVPSDADMIRCNSFQGMIPAEPVISSTDSLLGDVDSQISLSSQLDQVVIADEDENHNLSLVDEMADDTTKHTETKEEVTAVDSESAEKSIENDTSTTDANVTPKSKGKKRLQLDGITSDLSIKRYNS